MYRATTANLAHTHYYDPAAEFESIGLPQAAPEWEGGRSCSTAAPRFESIGLPKAAPEWEGGDAEDSKAPRELVFQPYCGPNFGDYGNEVRVMSTATYEEASTAILQAVNQAAQVQGGKDVYTNLGRNGIKKLHVNAYTCGWSEFGMDPDCYAKYVIRKPVRQIDVSFQWKDQGFGEEKGRCELRLGGLGQGLPPKHDLRPCKHHMLQVKETIGEGHQFFQHLQPGAILEIWFTVGGKDHQLRVQDFKVEIGYREASTGEAYLLYKKNPAVDPCKRKDRIKSILHDKHMSAHDRTAQIKAAMRQALPKEQPINSAFDLDVGIVCSEQGWEEAKEWAARTMDKGFKALRVAVVNDESAADATFQYRAGKVFGPPGNAEYHERSLKNLMTKEKKTVIAKVQQTKKAFVSGSRNSAVAASFKRVTQRAPVRSSDWGRIMCVICAWLAIGAALAVWVYFPVKEIDRKRGDAIGDWVQSWCPVTWQQCQLESGCGAGDCECPQRQLVHVLDLTPNCRWVDKTPLRRSAVREAALSQAEVENKEEFSLRATCAKKRFILSYKIQGPTNGPTAEKTVECNSDDYLNDETGLCNRGIGAVCGGSFVDKQDFCVPANFSLVGQAVPCWVSPETGEVDLDEPRGRFTTQIVLLVFAGIAICCYCCCAYLWCSTIFGGRARVESSYYDDVL